jgi:AraC family transcriptional regulator, regulatory protein of adaptative response / methylated-DNA-[protein]-cysteine methyltransferase
LPNVVNRGREAPDKGFRVAPATMSAQGAHLDEGLSMLHTIARQIEQDAVPVDPVHDYDRVRRALAFLDARWREQPSLESVAEHVGLSTSHFHQLFQRFAGITPKEFLQAITVDHARALLKDSASLLDASLEVGLSGPGRLHDLFIKHEAMTPGEWKAGGAGLTLTYGFHGSPFGEAIAVLAPRGLAALGWVDDKGTAGRAQDDGKHSGGRDGALADMRQRWPKATFQRDDAAAAAAVDRIFDASRWQSGEPLRIVMIGSDFEVSVWSMLLRIPLGQATTYGSLAQAVGKPGAARAVGAAVGRNPISFVVPCHRVLGASGALTGYHWGIMRKRAILGWEAGRVAGTAPGR